MAAVRTRVKRVTPYGCNRIGEGEVGDDAIRLQQQR
jgi:hypothetical protein